MRLPLCALFLLAACDGPAPTRPAGGDDAWRSLAAAEGVAVEYRDRDAALAPAIGEHALAGRSAVAAFFGEPRLADVAVRLYPDRASLTAYWRATWAGPAFQPDCWMIGSATAAAVALLSPSAWPDEACGHDPRDAAHVRRVVTHELVHVLHARLAGGTGTAGAQRWLYEGLAVHASGQLDAAARARVRALVAGGFAPARFADLWAGPLPYESSGTLVAYVDRTLGRDALRRLLRATSAADVAEVLGAAEGEVLAGWVREERE